MGTLITFLSGKGGSGKTTLALSVADLLCKCKIRTLLIDCDLSTNGATYFYETQLANWGQGQQSRPRSFNDLLNAMDSMALPEPFCIKNNLDFIPSISNITDESLPGETMHHSGIQTDHLHYFIDWAQHDYDVVLFDCQAGYTELLSVLLPLMDVDLFVLEADSISASAMRNLHLKIGSFLGRARLYQVFNKATQDEFEIYSKIIGTFFTNIGTILFDWKIRQAFSRSQVPDLENSSAQYGADLCDICKIIFPDGDIQEKLSRFSAKLHYRQLEERYKQIEEKLYSKKPPKLLLTALATTLICTIILFLFWKLIGEYLFTNSFDYIIILLLLFALTIPMLLLTDSLSERRKERRQYERELKNIDKEMSKFNYQLQNDDLGY